MDPTHEREDEPGWLGGVLGLLAVMLFAIPGAPVLAPVQAETPTIRVRVQDGEGAPIAGATIAWASGRVAGRTDAEGACLLRREGRRLFVRANGFAQVDVSAMQQSVVVTLPRARTLRGVARGPHGTPLVDVEVSLWPTDAEGALDEARTARRALTGVDGRFVLAELPEGPLVLRARAAGRATVTRRVLIDEHDISLVLAPAAVVSGQVYGGRGGPASGAEVRIVGSGIWPAQVARSDDEGRFRFDDVPSGIYELHARRGNEIAPPRQGLRVDDGASAFVTLRMIEGVALSGVVHDDAGAAVAGAEVALTTEGVALASTTATTDADGRFRVEGLLPGERWLTARAPGHVPTSVWVEPPTEVEVVLQRGASVSGIVLDARDRPVAGATVSWLGPASAGRPAGRGLGVTQGPVPPIPLDAIGGLDAPQLVTTGARAITGPDGRFVLEGIAPGAGEVHAEAGLSAPARSPALRLAPGDRITDVRLVTPDGGTIDGRVVDGRGFPLGSVLVELQAELEPWPRSMLANDDGTFSFEGVLGIAVLTARPYDLPPARERVEVRSGDRKEVTLEIPTDLVQLAVRVFDPEGFPMSDAALELQSESGASPFVRRGRTAPDGTFLFATLPPPPYRLRADHPDLTPREIAEITDVSAELRVMLARGGMLVGQVTDGWSRAPLVDVEVRLSGEDVDRRTFTDAEGEYAFERVPFGRYEIVAQSTGRLSETRTLDLTVPRVRLDELRLATSAVITGEVVDVLGDAVPDAAVTVGEVAARTDDGGAFRVEVAPGLHVVQVVHPTAGTAESPRVQIDASEERALRLVTDGRLGETEEPSAPQFRVGVPIDVTRRGNDIVITRVVGTGGTRALRVGDVLLEIDGETVLAAAQARGMLRGPDGVQSTLRIRRGTRTRRVVVRRRRYEAP